MTTLEWNEISPKAFVKCIRHDCSFSLLHRLPSLFLLR